MLLSYDTHQEKNSVKNSRCLRGVRDKRVVCFSFWNRKSPLEKGISARLDYTVFCEYFSQSLMLVLPTMGTDLHKNVSVYDGVFLENPETCLLA